MKTIASVITGILLAGVAGAQAAEPAGAKGKVHSVQPCCAVTAIDPAQGMATLKDLKTGATFQVKVRNKAKLKGLKVGQRVDRNF